VYAGVPPQKNNAVAGIMNLAHNIGGSIGIALVTTIIARHSQVHQAQLASSAGRYNHALQVRLAGIRHALEHTGASAIDAAHRGLAVVYRQIAREATALAYLDAFRTLALAALGMLALLALSRSVKPGRAPAGH
jgi:DHA2 family multidrug resistance protein